MKKGRSEGGGVKKGEVKGGGGRDTNPSPSGLGNQ